MSEPEQKPAKPKRRVRYGGTHPRRFEEKYKEHQPDKYGETVAKVLASGKTPAGMHRSIMVDEILATLEPKPGEIYLDATLGYGGHASAVLPRILDQRERTAQIRQRRRAFVAPDDTLQALAGAAQREIVTNQAEREVVGDDVRSREQHQGRGQHQADRIDGQPEAVLLEILLQLRAADVYRASLVHVVGKEERRRFLAPEMP